MAIKASLKCKYRVPPELAFWNATNAIDNCADSDAGSVNFV